MSIPVILASRSPRRKELLEKCGIFFSCEPAEIDETMQDTDDLREAVMDLSYRKARSVLKLHPDSLVIGSDTIVVCSGKILGKPADEQDAYDMLRMLSGREHQVITGLCFVSKHRTYRDASVSYVCFQELSDDEIWDYIRSGECMDKAGAYGIQGLGGKFITSIRGDYYSIMGLPLNLVYNELKNIELYENGSH